MPEPNQLTATIQEQVFEISTAALAALDLLPLPDGSYHLLQDGQAYHCQLEELDFNHKKLKIAINGNRFEVQLADAYDRLVKAMGLDVQASQGARDVLAPMPGLVLDILVEVGDRVEKGSPLLILEAMKMENVIKAEGEGLVKSIPLKKGMPVEKRQLLIEMEP